MRLRISAVQYNMKKIASFEEFAQQVKGYAYYAKDWNSRFIVFPEFLTIQLLSFMEETDPYKSIRLLPSYTEKYIELFSSLAKELDLYIVGGTHIIEVEGNIYNCAYLFYPDGSFVKQPKIHLTTEEKYSWKITPGDDVKVFDTEAGKVALIVCYDMEFPETARRATDLGANILFCPSSTDDRQGFYRVRYCCQARAVENQVYVVHTGGTGWMPEVRYMQSHYGVAAILAPCDSYFPPKGIVAEGDPSEEMVVTGEIDLLKLVETRDSGDVTTQRDRRDDLYAKWRESK
ncbi:Predicted amidohydrolase [Natronincola peptidivorans]|uniref:Predicted amidohydrolase n=1 Tax=Natronincola peptidivorans TaxID=426128 RepID=A0A1I0BUE8_9FIRM|nr:carbon-nitrogen hydrolase family protein [Natronincola peptidivorans]SET10680.1 Predicted amidohydrolase [Natronincola peptidivorans]